MKRGSLNWIITHDVIRILGDRYNAMVMYPELSNLYDEMVEQKKSTPQIRAGLVTKAQDIAQS